MTIQATRIWIAIGLCVIGAALFIMIATEPPRPPLFMPERPEVSTPAPVSPPVSTPVSPPLQAQMHMTCAQVGELLVNVAANRKQGITYEQTMAYLEAAGWRDMMPPEHVVAITEYVKLIYAARRGISPETWWQFGEKSCVQGFTKGLGELLRQK